MNEEYITITKELIAKASFSTRGLNKQQLMYLGFGYPLPKGKINQLIGSKIKNEDVEFLFRLKYMTKRKLKTIKITPIDLILSIRKNKVKNAKIKTNGFKSRSISFVFVNYEIEWKKQYNHPNWQRMRLFILDRDNFKCQKCGDEHSMLHIHHSHYSDGFIWEINPKYLVTLCDRCHSKAHKKK